VGGNLQQEVIWTSLKNMVGQANTNAQTAHIRLDQFEVCSSKAMFYMPSHGKADSSGCLSPIVKEVTEVVPISGGCKGLRCQVLVDMTPFLSYPAVSIEATCSGAWCRTNDDQLPITEILKLPNLTSSWSDLWVAGLRTGRKQSYIDASYNPSTQKITLRTMYTGDSTDTNLNATTISNIKIHYTYNKLGLPE